MRKLDRNQKSPKKGSDHFANAVGKKELISRPNGLERKLINQLVRSSLATRASEDAKRVMSENNVNALSFEFDRSNMFEPLLQADPSFRGKWEIFQEEYRSEEELPHYLALSELARHLIQDLATGNTHRFDAVFDVVERWHITGDPYVKEAATVGLLEDLQNGDLHHKTRPDDFLPWLRPETLEWWTKVHEFWATGKLII